MNVAVPRETVPGEQRVAVTPDVAGRLVKSGCSVVVERGAGERAGFLDAAYESAGAALAPDARACIGQADVVLKVQPPSDEEIAGVPAGATLIAFLQPLTNPRIAQGLARQHVTALAMELIPRISRAQNMDALSSQATVAGYKAVLIAADLLPKFFPMLMTAAGTIPPAKVFVIGAGVAGLQAIATARRLGAVVTGFDVRPVVKEQVESLGASFVSAEAQADAEGAGGYAKELSEKQQERVRQVIAKAVAESDVVVTTALVPGKRAPLLVTHAMVESMRPGSVIVDLAAEAGGNCEATAPGDTVTEHNVKIVGTLNLPSTMPLHASQLYAKNVHALFSYLYKGGALDVDPNDEIARGVCLTRGGEIVNDAVRALVAAGGPA